MLKNNYINNQQVETQKKIMEKIKQNNEIEYLKTGILKKAYVATFGCQQNVNDSEKLKGMLNNMGYEMTEDKAQADIILYNTCCVRENAELKVYGNIGALKELKKENPKLIIGICGCMMQQSHVVEFIRKKFKQVDLIFGTHNIHKFPEFLEKVIDEKLTLIDILDSEGEIFENIPILRESKIRAWISIMYGCNNFCSYCIVPYVRGRERSRTPEYILNEIKQMADQGLKEVTLLGQNVNSYGKDLTPKIDFADLLYMVNEIEGIERIRFMTSHPKDISDKLIQAMANCKKVCEHLHLPFQAGSNKVLKAMNRKYTKEEYLKKVQKIKATIPNIALSTDIIVGFPNETNEDFEHTLDVVRQVGFDQIFMFIYSKRRGTPAEKMEDVLTKQQKKDNFSKLLELQNNISKDINKEYLGKVVEILVEGPSKNNPDILTGRTRTNKVINFKGQSNLIDKIVNVKISETHACYLGGTI